MEKTNKYAWLVDTIRNAGRITFNEINLKWQDDFEDDQPLPLRTFHRWKDAAQDLFQINIDCDRRTNEYYISTPKALARDDLRRWLLETASLTMLLRDNAALSPRILLEEIPSAQRFLSTVIAAMKTNTVLDITYRSFSREQADSFLVEPYCVKCFRQRWYMLARSPFYDSLRLYALDRIQKMEAVEDSKFRLSCDFSAADYFAEYFGVIPNPDVDLEEIVLKVSADQSDYLRTLPLHASQQETECTDDYSLFTYSLRPTYDFKQCLLSLGAEAEVLSPAWLRGEMTDEVAAMQEAYSRKA